MKLFLSEESPSLIGLGAQDHLQAKASWPMYSTGAGSDDNLPPGFEGTHPSNVLQNKLSQIPVIQWQCPPRVSAHVDCFIFFLFSLMQSVFFCGLNLANNCRWFKICIKRKFAGNILECLKLTKEKWSNSFCADKIFLRP